MAETKAKEQEDQQAPPKYAVKLVKGARYNFKNRVYLRGTVIRVSAKDRNWLVRQGNWVDVAEHELTQFKPVPEEGEEQEAQPEVLSRGVVEAAQRADEGGDDSDSAFTPRSGGRGSEAVEQRTMRRG